MIWTHNLLIMSKVCSPPDWTDAQPRNLRLNIFYRIASSIWRSSKNYSTHKRDCYVIKPTIQWKEKGVDNAESFLNLGHMCMCVCVCVCVCVREREKDRESMSVSVNVCIVRKTCVSHDSRGEKFSWHTSIESYLSSIVIFSFLIINEWNFY